MPRPPTVSREPAGAAGLRAGKVTPSSVRYNVSGKGECGGEVVVAGLADDFGRVTPSPLRGVADFRRRYDRLRLR